MPDLNEDNDILSAYFKPTAPLTIEHKAESSQALEGSTFQVEDIFDSHKVLSFFVVVVLAYCLDFKL